jgi:hypothetical protein
MSWDLLNTNPVYERENAVDDLTLRAEARRLFARMEMDGKLHRLMHTLKRKPSRLLNRATFQSASCIPNRHYAGRISVPIDLIQGSEGRTQDFDDAFYPLHDRMQGRWVNVASVRLADEGLPPVELLHNDGIYFVRDGHHRISVAKALGEAYIDAEVIEETC